MVFPFNMWIQIVFYFIEELLNFILKYLFFPILLLFFFNVSIFIYYNKTNKLDKHR